MSSSPELCAGCGQACLDACLVSGTQSFHLTCLKCAACKKTLDSSFCEKDGQRYCVDDFKQLFLPKCATCFQVMEGKITIIEGKQYHPNCVKIETTPPTSAKSTTSPTATPTASSSSASSLHQDRPNCCICHNVISGRILEALNKNYHENCFKCSKCDVKLDGNFFEIDKKPYCEKDHKLLTTLHCYSCGNQITTSVFVSQHGQQFHNGCIRCAICKLTLISGEKLADTTMIPGTKMRVHSHCFQDQQNKQATIQIPPVSHVSIPSQKQQQKQQEKNTWVATIDDESGDVYYVKTETQDVTWERPLNFNGPLMTREGVLIAPHFPVGATFDIKTQRVITSAILNPLPDQLDTPEMKLLQQQSINAAQQARMAAVHDGLTSLHVASDSSK